MPHGNVASGKDLSDNAISDRLTQTMDAFNKAKQERDLPSPVIELTYPIACFHIIRAC